MAPAEEAAAMQKATAGETPVVGQHYRREAAAATASQWRRQQQQQQQEQPRIRCVLRRTRQQGLRRVCCLPCSAIQHQQLIGQCRRGGSSSSSQPCNGGGSSSNSNKSSRVYGLCSEQHRMGIGSTEQTGSGVQLATFAMCFARVQLLQ